MFNFQWLYGQSWIDCTRKSNLLLSKRRQNPCLDSIFLINDYGELWGCPEQNKMKFRIHGSDEEIRSIIRLAPGKDESQMFAVIKDEEPFLLPYDACVALFHNGLPKNDFSEIKVGTEHFIAEKKQLYQVILGEKTLVRYQLSDLSKGQYEDLAQARYKWRFKGPMRWDRMCTSVRYYIEHILDNPVKKKALKELFDHFDPTEDTTEYGPYQFADFLVSCELYKMAEDILEIYNSQPLDDWSFFDDITNIRIEKARELKKQVVMIQIHNEPYMVIFDSGTGASGSSAVLFRATRYKHIMDSIEEQFIHSEDKLRKELFASLFNLLQSHSINPRLFMTAMMGPFETNLESIIHDNDLREQVIKILERINSTAEGNLSTRFQEFMPPLVEKFKECEIDYVPDETLRQQKMLCPSVQKTLKDGFCIPASQKVYCPDFKHMIHFIYDQQSWKLPNGLNTCNICGNENKTTLKHCSGNACLKCWVETLAKTNMRCPFCRERIEEKSLKLSVQKRKRISIIPVNISAKKNKKNKYSTEQILERIHKLDEKYLNIKETSSETMRRWFTILLRCKLIQISQMPRNVQGKQSFKKAMKLFHLN